MAQAVFLLDVWNDQLLNQAFPHLFSYVKDQRLTVSQVAQTTILSDIFHLPLSEDAFQQFQELGVKLSDLHLNDESDRWMYIWGSAEFTPHKAYKQLKGSIHVHPIFHWLWKTCCQKKERSFSGCYYETD
jgi:hypothetical protein